MTGEGVALRLSEGELALLALALGSASGGPPADGPAVERELRARRLLERAPDGRWRIDQVAVALLGTWLRPEAGVRVALGEAGAVRQIDLYHRAGMTVEHSLEGGGHEFLAHASLADLAGRLGALAGLTAPGTPGRPAGERLWLPAQTVEAVWEAAAVAGAAGVRQVLARAPQPPADATARALARALAGARRLVRLEVFSARVGGRTEAPASRGGLRLMEGRGGYWAFTTSARFDAVDVRPVSGDEVGGLLTVLAAAVWGVPAPGLVPAPVRPDGAPAPAADG